MSQIKSRGPMPIHVRKQWEDALAAVDPGEIEAVFEQSRVAAAEETFSGFVRRCVQGAHKPISMLGGESQIDPARLADFLHGEGLLDSSEMDRLLAALHVELVDSASTL